MNHGYLQNERLAQEHRRETRRIYLLERKTIAHDAGDQQEEAALQKEIDAMNAEDLITAQARMEERRITIHRN